MNYDILLNQTHKILLVASTDHQWFMQTVSATTQRRYDPISDRCIFRYSVISSSVCIHGTVKIFLNKQITNCNCHFDRVFRGISFLQS